VSDRDLLNDQIAYYRARAGEYDTTSSPDGDPFTVAAARIRRALDAFEPTGRVLEIAAGTGQWTGQLARHAASILVTDAAPEMLERNRARTGERPGVRYEVADAFRLRPSHSFDVVFFGFFLSHVPPERFAGFWAALDGVLVPEGRVFFVDEGRHFLWREDWIDEGAGVVRRTLTDGTVHRAVKVLWDAGALERQLGGLGWDASVTSEEPFYWGSARRSDGSDGNG
jgi:demethylmenaquinone methyltransferase/2-methoxy-6-polyprenyl-1,4-benzoquinol methylase